MPDPAAAPTPSRARVGLLAAGLLLLAAGVALVAWVLASAAGLVGRDDPATADLPAATAPGAAARTVAYRLEPAGGAARTVRLEVAADPAARARGLMGRREVPEGTGMVFLYPEDVTEA